MHLYWQDLGWDCYTSFFTNLYQHYRPWFTAEFRLRTLSWEQIDRFIAKYPYALILTRLRLDCYVIFRSYIPELWPLMFYVHWYWQDLGWDCTCHCAHLYQSYDPWISPEFLRFRSISWEQIDRFSPNFISAFILTRSRLGLLHLIFHIFVPELWPLIYCRISIPLNILRTNWQIFTILCICIDIDKI